MPEQLTQETEREDVETAAPLAEQPAADVAAEPPAAPARPRIARRVLARAREVEITGELLIVALCAVLAVWFAYKAITTYTGFESLGRGLVIVAGSAAVVVALRAGPGLAGGRYVAVHAHTHAEGEAEDLRRTIARHEAGHAVAMEDGGGKVKSARVFSGGTGGLVKGELADGTHEEITTAAVAFLRAGRLAVGTDEGASADMNAETQRLRSLPRRDRDRVDAAATRMAEGALARNATKLQRYADRLHRRGRL